MVESIKTGLVTYDIIREVDGGLQMFEYSFCTYEQAKNYISNSDKKYIIVKREVKEVWLNS